MKKWLGLVWVCCLLFGMTAQAELLIASEHLISTVQTDFPGWTIVDHTRYGAGLGLDLPMENVFAATLTQWQDESLLVREIEAITNDLAPGDPVTWKVADFAPVSLTPEAKARLSAIPAADLFGSCFDSVGLHTDDLTGCAEFLLDTGESLRTLLTYPDMLVGVVEDGAGHSALRIAAWDGMAYTHVTSTAMMDGEVWFDDTHSGFGHLYFGVAHPENIFLEASAMLDEDGVWRITGLQEAYSITPTGLVVGELLYDTQSNGSTLYGRFTAQTALDGLDLATLWPANGDYTSLLDPTGYACVKHEGASLFDAPDGHFLASCFQRLPGVVIAEEGDWVQLQIGSEAAGMQGWFRREDLAFGAEVNEIRCTFPSYELPDVSLETLLPGILARLNWTEDWDPYGYSLDFWLIGTGRDGNFLALVDSKAICSLPLDAFTRIGPTYPGWLYAE